MNNAETQSITNISSRAIFGPICILLGLSLLYFRESSQFVALTASALLGLMLCWKWEKNGLILALSALCGVILYQAIWGSSSLNLWELGLASSLAIAFITTFLAKTEINDIVEEQAQERIEALQSEYFAAKETLSRYEKIIREKNSKIESLEKSSPNEALLLEKDALIAELQQKASSESNDEVQEMVKRYESAIHEKNVLIDDLHERLDRIENLNGTEPTSSKEVFRKYEESLQEKIAIISEKESALQALQTQVNSLVEKEAELLSLKIKVESLEGAQSDAVAMQHKLVELEQLHKDVLKEKTENLETAQSEITSLQFKLLEIEKELKVKDAAFENLVEGKNIDSGKLELAMAEKDAVLEDLKSKSEFLEVVQAEASALQYKIVDFEKTIGELQEVLLERTQAQENDHEKIRDLESEIDNLFSSLHHERDHNEALKKKIEVLHGESSDHAVKDRKIQQLEESYRMLREQVKEHEGFNFAKLLEKDRLNEQHLSKIKELEKQLDLVANHEVKINELEKQKANLASAHEATVNVLEKQLDDLATNHEVKINELEKQKASLVSVHETKINVLEKQLEVEKDTSYRKTELVTAHEGKIKELTSQMEELIEKLKKIESEKGELEGSLGNDESGALAKSLARAEGMYRQLREQFEEKSKVLNLTRRELFQMTEEKNTLELHYLEETLYGRNDIVENLEKYILNLNHLIESQENEIESLHELVDQIK